MVGLEPTTCCLRSCCPHRTDSASCGSSPTFTRIREAKYTNSPGQRLASADMHRHTDTVRDTVPRDQSRVKTRPAPPAPLVENIPAELKNRPQWVVWRYELRGDKWAKVPYTPGTTCKAASTRPATWHSFDAAIDCYQARPDFFD